MTEETEMVNRQPIIHRLWGAFWNFNRRLWGAFKNFAIVFSFVVNLILILILALLVVSADSVFTLKSHVAEPLLVDLDQAFAALGETTITSMVFITDTMPVIFDLPLEQNTQVILTDRVPLNVPATFVWPAGGGQIHGRVIIELPQGQALPIALSMSVPVSTTVPVVMQVPVEIPLSEAGMGPAITQLRAVFNPVTSFVQSLPNTTDELLDR